MEQHSVYSIDISDGKTTIAYSVTPDDKAPESCTVCRSDKPHEDFLNLMQQVRDMDMKFIEFDLTGYTYTMYKIRFLTHKEGGIGVRIWGEIDGLEYSTDGIKIVTPKYYEIPNDDGKQLLTKQEAETLKKLQEEAFLYAYCGKRLQPTVDEAQRAYENGGKFLDEAKV